MTDVATAPRRATIAAAIASWALVGVGLAIGYVILLWVESRHGHLTTGDTNMLVTGARNAADCVHLGVWRSCDHVAPGGSVAPFPLLQYLPTLAMIKLGWADLGILRGLARVNVAAFAGTLVLTWLALRARPSDERRWLAPVAVAALLGSSAAYQATSGFGEMLAAFTVAAAVTACVYRRPALIVPATALAMLGKETLFPFVIVLCVLAARRDEDVLPPRRVLASIGVGALAGVALNVLFNEFRFGTLRNVAYLDPRARTPGLGRKLDFAVAGWFSPTSGIAWYWPAATLLLVAVVAVSVVALVRWREWRLALPPLLAVSTAVAMVTGLGFWYSPFGWVTFGPRLAVPILPATLIVALRSAGPLLARPVRALGRWGPRSLRTAGVLVVALVFAALGWPQYGATWTWPLAIGQLLAPDSTCPSIEKVRIEQGYFACASHVMWRLHSSPLDEAAFEGQGPVAAGRALGAAASIALVAAGLASLGVTAGASASGGVRSDEEATAGRALGGARGGDGARPPVDVGGHPETDDGERDAAGNEEREGHVQREGPDEREDPEERAAGEELEHARRPR